MKADQSLEKYKKAAAWMLLLKNVFAKTFVAVDGILTRQETRSFDRFQEGLGKVSNLLDSYMHEYHTEEAAWNVFYGRLNPDGYDEGTGKEVREMAKSYMKDLFEDN